MGLAVVVSSIARFFRQPLLVSYIVTGLLISFVLGYWVDLHTLETFAHLGVVLLLFIVGLSLNPRVVQDMSKVAFLTGLGQIIFTSLVGYGIGIALGFSQITALYVAVAFTFSSTVVVIKLLHDQRDEETLYGRIVIGLLLVQDLVAMVFLIGASAFSQAVEGADIASLISLSILNLSIITLLSFILGYYIVPKVDKFFAKDSEVLLIFSLTVCFGIVAGFYLVGFPMEIGALLAGVILASSAYQREIASRIKPLRDFFLVIFFVMLGFTMELESLRQLWWPAIWFSLFVLVGNPLIMMVVLRILKYSKKTGFYAGLAIAQISEFSLILLMLGASLGHIDKAIVSMGTLVGLITITGSSYMISYANKLYIYLGKYLEIFDIKEVREKEKKRGDKSYEVVLFGFHRLGGGIIKYFKRMRTSFLVVDYDPEIVEDLRSKKVNVQFGDAGDVAFLDTLPLSRAKLIISTIPEVEENIQILKHLKKSRARAATVCVAGFYEDARELYKAGAEYVVMPPHLGRRYIAELVSEFKFDKKKYRREQKRHLKEMDLVGL